MKAFNINTPNNTKLPALIFQPEQVPKGTILLQTGLGIPKEFYKKYSEFLAKKGYITLVYDYRGIGKSVQPHQSMDSINLRNWGLIDMVAALDYLKTTYPTLKHYVIGHSIGAQIIGFMKNHAAIEKIIMVSVTGGYWQDLKFPINMMCLFMWYIHLPTVARLFGYLPQGLTYRGVKVAKGVALEWAQWSRKKAYFSAFFKKTIPIVYFKDIHQQIDGIWFTDDDLATPKAVESILRFYPNADIRKHWINPKDYTSHRIGHSGFFSEKAGEKLWSLPLNLIEQK